MPFTLGQRWISDTESELGLGTVVAMDARTVTLLFPATGENRLYARSDSPVTRVMFNPGDTVTSHEGWQLTVEDVKEEMEGYAKYDFIGFATHEQYFHKDCFCYQEDITTKLNIAFEVLKKHGFEYIFLEDLLEE